MADKKYDVGIYGLWYGNNYGSMITYYALSRVIEKMGKTYAMINNPLSREPDIGSLRRSHPLGFGYAHYDITEVLPLKRMAEHNKMFDTFILGSDQMWNYHLSRPYQQSYFLDFVQKDKKKIAYATSFGKDKYIGPAEEKPITKSNLKRFDAISVRDDFSKRICEQEFDVPAELVLDPVFLCEKKNYESLIRESYLSIGEPFIFAYILDPNPGLGEALQNAAEKSNMSVYVAFNESGDMQKCREPLRVSDGRIRFLTEPTVQEWLYMFSNSRFVLTDSFHGSCFSIIFEKPFIVLKNNARGGQRFTHLLGTAGLLDYMVESPVQMLEKFNGLGIDHKIDYSDVRQRMEPEINRSYQWLSDAVSGHIRNQNKSAAENTSVQQKTALSAAGSYPADPILPKAPAPSDEPMKLHPEIARCRLVASVMKAYGIRHIVISSGTRNFSLARFFEANDCFTTYNVTDERSAAYFAMGLSIKLNYEPVVITCTSGTALCNYLPGVTEAFYQRVPLIIITGDRFPCHIGQMEAQTIKQYGLFRDVCKKSVDLPMNFDSAGSWESRRKICDAVLECTHFVKGPVHINVPINFIENDPPEAEALALTKVKTIRRIDHFSSPDEWEKAADTLRRCKKIMVIYGQNNPLSGDDKKYFEEFVSKYNCVVLTDHLSNVYGEYCLNPYRLMKKLTNDQFKQTLFPDLIIYVGGKRVLNCPLQGKIKSIKKDLPFWHVIEDGSVCDIYRKLTHVFGCSQTQFFKYFCGKAGDIHNNKVYLNEWKEAAAQVSPVDYTKVKWTDDKFTSYYTMGRLLTNLPKNSMLHLAVGNTFINSQNYPIDPTTTVYCNMGTNGIDGSCSTFIGQCVPDDKLSFLLIGDLSFFYDMNSLWNKNLKPNVRILLNNDHGAGLLRHFQSYSITQPHGAVAEGWVRSLGQFKYICAHNKEEFDRLLPEFTDPYSDKPIFFEVLMYPQN